MRAQSRGPRVRREGPERRLFECRRFVCLEQEAGDTVVDGVHQSAHPASDRERTVALCPHLGKPARLVERGHQKQVHAGHQAVLEHIPKIELDADPVGGGGCQGHEGILVGRVAAAEEDELRVVREQPLAAKDQVQPLLLDQPTGHPEERHVGPLGEAIGQLEARLAAALALEVVGRIRHQDLRVREGVPDSLVDPVQDPDQPITQGDKHVVQTEATARGPQISGLLWAHRERPVRKREAALEKVDLAVPLELSPVVQLDREAQLEQRFGSELALVSGVVDRNNGERVADPGLARQDGPQIHRRQRAVPVMGVQNQRPRRDPRQGQAGRQRQEREAPRVVDVVAPGLAVDARAVEESI